MKPGSLCHDLTIHDMSRFHYSWHVTIWIFMTCHDLTIHDMSQFDYSWNVVSLLVVIGIFGYGSVSLEDNDKT